MVDRHWTETFSGQRFDIANPDPKSININDIACGLAKTARFNGQTKGLLSVATHCINTERLLREWGQPVIVLLEGLLHDAAEAYVHDLSSPLKSLLPEYKVIEKRVFTAILKGLGLAKELCLTNEQQKIVKRADTTLLITECRDFKARTNWNFYRNDDQTLKPWKRKLKEMGWRAAERKFLKRYWQLREQL